jgi:hypothetical protein
MIRTGRAKKGDVNCNDDEGDQVAVAVAVVSPAFALFSGRPRNSLYPHFGLTLASDRYLTRANHEL